MVAPLKEKGVSEKNIINKIIEGGKLNEAFCIQYFPDVLKWLF